MSLNLSAVAVRERAVTLFLILMLVAAGAYAFVMLGRAEDPSFTIKTLTVTTAWPGATAREMQDLVAEPLEKRLQELTWYDRLETTTRPGYAYMTVTLKDSTPPSVVQEEFYRICRKPFGNPFSLCLRQAPEVHDVQRPSFRSLGDPAVCEMVSGLQPQPAGS
jgi:hypothetical protein